MGSSRQPKQLVYGSTRNLLRNCIRPPEGQITDKYGDSFVMEFNIASDTETLTIPCQNVDTFDAVIDWGDGNSSTITTYNDADLAHEYVSAGIYLVSISGTLPNIYFDNSGDKLKLTKILNLGDVGFTTLERAFYGCTNLTRMTVGTTDTSAVTNMAYMVRGCSSLLALNVSSFDTGAVTTMSNMFYGCSGLLTLDIFRFDTAAVTTMSNMFYSCSSLTTLDVSNFDTAEVMSMYRMFYNCSSLTALDVSNFDTVKVTTMTDMFLTCAGLPTVDVSNFDTAEVTAMGRMFYSCSNLTSLDVSGFDTAAVTSMYRMFYGCSGLPDIVMDGWDIEKVANFAEFLYGVTLPTARYDATLIAWDAQNPIDSLTVDFGNSKYTSGGAVETARTSLSTGDSWGIQDGGAV